MVRKLVIALGILLLTSCATRKVKSGFGEITDFGLSDDGAGVKVDDKAYFDDLKRSESSVAFESSLPLPLRVGKTVDPFDLIPPLAKQGVDSRLNISIGPCSFTLLSGPVQVDRYLLAGQWIKLTEGLPANTPVKLEPNQDLNIKALTKVGIEISESMTPYCRKMFEGKSKVPLGRFHLNRSRLGLVPGPGSPVINFGSRSLDPQGKMIYIHWQSGSNLPSLIDDFDFPATAESGIFRAQMAAKGYYYLAFQAVLRMDQIDSMLVKLPYHGPAIVLPPKPVPSNTGLTTPPMVANPIPVPQPSQTTSLPSKALPSGVGVKGVGPNKMPSSNSHSAKPVGTKVMTPGKVPVKASPGLPVVPVKSGSSASGAKSIPAPANGKASPSSTTPGAKATGLPAKRSLITPPIKK